MESLSFIRKEFIEAYRLAPIGECMRPALAKAFPSTQLAGMVKRLTGKKQVEAERELDPATIGHMLDSASAVRRRSSSA